MGDFDKSAWFAAVEAVREVDDASEAVCVLEVVEDVREP